MGLITQISLQNFLNYRDHTVLDLKQLSYLIGTNNAGKTNIFHGIRAFFDDTYFTDGSFLNKTTYLARKVGYNVAELGLKIDLGALSTKSRKASLIKEFGNSLELIKRITYTPEAGVKVSWRIGQKTYKELPDNKDLPGDVIWLLSKIKITYIHPQEGAVLLSGVQNRLRQRLLANWGRDATLAHSLSDLENNWMAMRTLARQYLSKSLSESLQKFWPGCSVSIDLPKTIKEIVEISDINFQTYQSSPEIQLTAQGTGAQSTVLYMAQYTLDSDRTLNRGEYHPLWLLEEPESFLHADLLLKLSSQIHSELWIKNIQMIISTHSSILLASSRNASSDAIWNVLTDRKKVEKLPLSAIDERKVVEIGDLMGDPNFFAYFSLSQDTKLIFIEDERAETAKVFIDAGIPITSGPRGIADIGRFLDIMRATPQLLRTPAYFIIDADKGINGIKRHLENSELVEDVTGIKKYKIKNITNAFLIVLPDGMFIERLFSEYENHVRECVAKIWKPDFTLQEIVPTNLSRVMGDMRAHPKINTEQEALSHIQNKQDVKDLFWKEVAKSKLKMSSDYITTFKTLLGIL